MSKKFLPNMSIGFDNAKVQVHHMDGSTFVSNKKESFDVIITDSSDPVGKVCSHSLTLSLPLLK